MTEHLLVHVPIQLILVGGRSEIYRQKASIEQRLQIKVGEPDARIDS